MRNEKRKKKKRDVSSIYRVCFSLSPSWQPRKKRLPPNRSRTHSRTMTKKPFSKEEGTESDGRCPQTITTMSSNIFPLFFVLPSLPPNMPDNNNQQTALPAPCCCYSILRSFLSPSRFLHTPRNRLSAQPSLLLKTGGDGTHEGQ